MAIIVSILGYAKSGKTSFAEALLRGVTGAGFTAAAIKAGREAHQDGPHRSTGGPGNGQTAMRLPDSRRLAAAGAKPVILWTGAGAEEEEETPRQITSEPLPSRVQFGEVWERLLPAELVRALHSRDLLLLEGRLLPGALMVQMRQQGSGAVKYALTGDELILRGEEEFGDAIETILERLRGIDKIGRASCRERVCHRV